MYKEVQVTTDLRLAIYDDTLEIWSGEAIQDVPIANHELPALLAALEKAAGEMGISIEAQRLRFENKQRQDFIEELLLMMHPKSAEIMRQRLADMLAEKYIEQQ